AGHVPGCLLRKGGDVSGLGSKQRQRLAYFLALRFEAGSFANLLWSFALLAHGRLRRPPL
ncbi:hypothetical protein, partial [Paenibacillus maysiensis]|uniref:hypothetical protein n=1 Tax=Paenibacillus maysiensis TaxID=1155954 RepID=UPI001AE02E22